MLGSTRCISTVGETPFYDQITLSTLDLNNWLQFELSLLFVRVLQVTRLLHPVGHHRAGFRVIGRDKVEDDICARRDDDSERPDHRVQVTGADGDTRLRTANTSDQARQDGSDSTDKGRHRSQVEAVEVKHVGAGTKLVQFRQVEVTMTDEPVVGQHDSADRAEEHRVAREESRERLCRVLDVPGSSSQGNEDADELSPSNVDVPREGKHEVVGDGGSIGRDVGRENGETEAKCDKEHRCAIHEHGDLKRVPGVNTVNDLACGCDNDTEDGAKGHEAEIS